MDMAATTPVNANARRQAAFVARKQKEGKKRKLYWLTPDEHDLVQSVLEKRRSELAGAVSNSHPSVE